MNLQQIQRSLVEAGLDGWLFCDFRGSDPLAYSILGLDRSAHATRRWYYFVPSQDEPTRIVHAIEAGILDRLPGTRRQYLSWEQLHQQLRQTLAGARRVAMQYSPRNDIPYVARVDAGTVELVRSFGPEVVSSADLVQQFEAVWTEDQYRTHLFAADKIGRLVTDTFAEIGRRVRGGGTTEYAIQQLMADRYLADGLVSDHPPIVAAGPNTADPHYLPSAASSRPIRSGDLVLIDTWAKQDVPQAVYFDITWVGFVGQQPPEEAARLFEIVRQARDQAIRFVRQAIAAGQSVCGWEVDEVARNVIRQAGYGEQFIHRTGHSIHTEVHGNGANLDNLETRDQRRLIPGTCFSVEPGIYLQGRFGIRSEVDVYLTDQDALVTGPEPQTRIVCIA